MSDLHVTATPDLLDGWTGQALLQTQGARWVEGVVLDGDHAAHFVGGSVYRDSIELDLIRRIRLDLSRAECRDRVCRVLAARLLREVPANGDGYSWRMEPVSCSWELQTHNRNWMARFAADTSGWFAVDEGNRTGRFPSRSVPALADLDPDDDTRLPDGSRRVDALALAACWREVSRG